LTLLTSIACQNKTKHAVGERGNVKNDTIFIHDTIFIYEERNGDWQEEFGLSHDPKKDSIWGKPVSYYIEDEDCNAIAFDFYYGYIRPSDNGTTTELLKLACSDNKKLRPFYRWCLHKTLLVSDGALSESVGVPARKYTEKFPDEFFEFLDFEKNKEEYEIWTSAIQYSGFFDYPNFKSNGELIDEHFKRMSKNLKIKSEKNLKRVRKFAQDCQAP
jgi:hypothetical protein